MEAYVDDTRNEITKLELQTFKQNISANERKAIQELKGNKEIVIKKADKCSNIVIMNKTDYIKEAEFQLESIHYQRIEEPNMKEIQKKVNSTINEMRKQEEIDKQTYNFLAQSTNKNESAHLYILPKIHKLTQNQLQTAERYGLGELRVPGRPIISQVATPTYHIGHLVHFFLRPWVDKLPTYFKRHPSFHKTD